MAAPPPTRAAWLFAGVVCVLFPAPCRLCGARLHHADRLPVCDACLATITPLAGPACRVCGQALAREPAEDIGPGCCASCRLHPPEYEGAICAALYRERAQELIHLMKFQRVRTAADFWAARLAALAPSLPAQPDILVPVPLGKRRMRERGFNQSGDVARHLAKRLGRRYEAKGLRRVRETKPQSELHLEDRAQNLKNAFAADPRRVEGKCVLLVDDVLTTGATARAGAHALRQAGAVRVMLATAARTDRLWPATLMATAGKGAAA